MGPMVKGPMLVTDMVCWHVGMGMGLYDVKPLALGVANRQRIPRFFKLDDQGIPDVQQRVHWDPEWARRAGNPTTYDYGRMRETWLIHLCTDWMGDDAWLWKLECSFRGFNYVGDVHHLTGTITRKYLADGDRPAVDLELAATNQRGTNTTPGTATILLPSREHGPVRLPDPPGTDLESSLTAISEAFSSDEGRLEGGRPMSPYESVDGLDIELAEGVLTLRLARPDKRNALNDTMVYAAIDAVDLAGRDEAVRAILLTSDGRALLLRLRLGGAQPGGQGDRAQAPRRQHPAPAPVPGPPVGPAAVHGAAPGRVRGAGLGRRHRAQPRRWPPTSPSRPTTRASGRRSSTAASRPTAATRGCCRAASARCGPAR